MARPKVLTAHIKLRVSDEWMKTADSLAKRFGVSRAEAIRMAVILAGERVIEAGQGT